MVKIKCETLDDEAFGISRIGKMTYVVENLLPGEVCEIEELRKTKHVTFGYPKRFIHTSPDRSKIMCPYYADCGSCNIMHMNYARQLAFKNDLVKKMYSNIDVDISSCIGMDEPYHYRNKVQIVLGPNYSGGFYKRETHELINIDKCLLEPPLASKINRFVKDLLRKYKISIYSSNDKSGLLRYVLSRYSRLNGNVMVVLVATKYDPVLKNVAQDLTNHFNEVVSVILNINDKQTNTILGQESMTLFGNDFIIDQILGCKYQISAKSFFQINNIQTEKLYETAIDCLDIDHNSNCIDAYSGIGSISLLLAKKVKHVYGIEIVESAYLNAIENKKLNNINNVDFLLGPCEVEIKKLVSEKTIDAIVFDPPRKGCDKEFLDTVIEMKIPQIAYISCNIKTQVRDVKYLMEHGYVPKKVIPVDMFPMTTHVETVCLLSKLNAKEHIEVELDMDELDLTTAESKATYEEIKEYVLEHTGLKVSHLYIAQVKQKYGIIERENYNKPKSENSRQPKCPPEKEAAITDALKFFGML